MWFDEVVWGLFSNWIGPPTKHRNQPCSWVVGLSSFFSFHSMMPYWTAVTAPCRGTLSSYLQAVDINSLLRDEPNLLCFHSFCRMILHMWSVQKCGFHVLGIQLYRCDVILDLHCESLLVPVRQVLWLSICFHPQEFNALELHIKERNRRLCTLVAWLWWGKLLAQTIKAQNIMGTMSIIYHSNRSTEKGIEKGRGLRKGECTHLLPEIWDIFGKNMEHCV